MEFNALSLPSNTESFLNGTLGKISLKFPLNLYVYNVLIIAMYYAALVDEDDYWYNDTPITAYVGGEIRKFLR